MIYSTCLLFEKPREKSLTIAGKTSNRHFGQYDANKGKKKSDGGNTQRYLYAGVFSLF